MALSALPNSFVAADDKIGVFVGNSASRYRVGRLNGTGTPLITTASLTVGNHNVLIVYLGTSHIASGVAPAPQTHISALLAASGSYVAYNNSSQVFAQNGGTSAQIKDNLVPQAVAFINANKAGKTLVVAVLEGMINDLIYAPAGSEAGVIANIRASGAALAAAGAKVILCPSPPAHPLDGSQAFQTPITDQMRVAIGQDMIDNTSAYSAVDVLSSFTQDPQLYPLRAYETYPSLYADATHYSTAGQFRWGQRHLLPAILRVVKLYSTGTVIVAPPAAPSWQNVVFPVADSALFTITGNSLLRTAADTYQFTSTAYSQQQVPANADGGFRFTCPDNPFQQNIFVGFDDLNTRPIKLDNPVGFPFLGISLAGDGTWSPSNNDGFATSYPWAAGDVLEAQRVGGMVEYRKNGSPITSLNVSDLGANALTVKVTTAWQGTGLQNVQMITSAAGGLINR